MNSESSEKLTSNTGYEILEQKLSVKEQSLIDVECTPLSQSIIVLSVKEHFSQDSMRNGHFLHRIKHPEIVAFATCQNLIVSQSAKLVDDRMQSSIIK